MVKYDKPNGWNFFLLLLLPLVFISLFIIKGYWICLIISIFASFFVIGILTWYLKPYFSLNRVEEMINNKVENEDRIRTGNQHMSNLEKEMRKNYLFEDYLEMRVNYYVGKNNFIGFSLLTFALVLATLFNNSSDFRNIFGSLKEDSISKSLMNFFVIFGGDYATLGFLIVLLAGLLFLYLITSMLFRYEFNRFTQYHLRVDV